MFARLCERWSNVDARGQQILGIRAVACARSGVTRRSAPKDQGLAHRLLCVALTTHGTGRLSVRGPFVVGAAAAAVALLIALLVPVINHAWKQHDATVDASHQRHALAIASRVTVPSSFTPTSRLGGLPCVGGANLRCWMVTGTPADAAPLLAVALRTAGQSPLPASCHGQAAIALSPPTKGCLVRVTTEGWDIDLVAITNVVHAKLVRPKPGHPFVPPKAHVAGTEVILSAGPH
jgi:hypothetical protein